MTDKFNIKINKETEPVIITISDDLAELLNTEVNDGISIGDNLVLYKGLFSCYNVVCAYEGGSNELHMKRRFYNGDEASISSSEYWIADVTDLFDMPDEVREKIKTMTLKFSADLQRLESIRLNINNSERNHAKDALYEYITEEIFKKYSGGQGAVEGNFIDVDGKKAFEQIIDVEHMFKLWDRFESEEAQAAMMDIVTPDAPAPEIQQP